MATLNEIAYNIRNIVEGGVSSDDSNLSIRQIKYLVHTKRAELLLKYTDSGKKTSEVVYQIDKLTPLANGAILKEFVGFNNNKSIRSVAYRDSSSIEASMELLPIVQDHDRMFLQESKFMKNVSRKHATLADNRIYLFEGDTLITGGVLEVKGIFADPTKVSSYVNDETTHYPIPNELLSILTQEIIGKEVALLYNLSVNTPNNQTDEKTKSKEVQR